MIRLEDGRYVAPEDDSPEETATLADTPEARLSLSRLTLRRFAQHRLGLISALFLLTCYLLLPLVGFIAPYGPNTRDAEHIFAPPQLVRVFDEGGLTAPYIYPLRGEANLAEYRWDYTPDRAAPQTLQWFCPGDPYSLAGLIPSTTHLFCAPEGETVFLWGSDRLGRDVFSRILYGAQLSLTVGLVGIAISMGLGIFFGSIAGYFGGGLDYAIQRLIEILRSIPELPLWLALSAAVPSHWGPVSVFFAISIILGLLDWPGLARAVRAKFFSLREEDFVQAAEMMGAKPSRIIRRHLLPNFRSHLIASAALSIPSMILGETALSFLGLGLRAPAVSWGVMLNDAQHLSSIEIYPWTALPMLPIIIVVLAFSFMGDGLRDALDPHRS
ncbi:ABC transporter permease [Maritimibacter alkaliphilus]|uniref:ABC transporter permease n=1 Tax=Maritimibacter alkaliphilus TaxID=404236 RepID=UPI001C966006|nr:ABC transporter permease [Maritimibacter alkaliphilus]MBY6091939.1 ABC transporter permease [Maritimibacter alkaliphilus]